MADYGLPNFDWMNENYDFSGIGASKASTASTVASTANAAGGTDWSTFLFGNKEQAGAVGVGVQALGGVVQSWLGYENLKLSKENLAFQKQAYEQNVKTANMEAALKLDARKRGLAFHGVSSDVVDKYAAQYQ